jgi:hypothetical protein
MRVWPLAFLALGLLVVACPGAGSPGGGPASKKTREITLFFTTEMKGTLEPCGCNSDPLGDLARTAALLAETRKTRAAALLDGGSTLYSENPLPKEKVEEETRKAALLAKLLPGLGLAGAGLGPLDLARGKEGVLFPRQAANVSGGAPVEAPRITDVGGVKLGVFGVVDPALVPGASEPAAAAKKAIADLRAQGAEIVVALAHMGRAPARRLAKEVPGADLVLVGADAADRGLGDPELVGNAWLFQPGNRGQVLTRIDLTIDPAGGPLADAIGPGRAKAQIEDVASRIAKLDKDLAAWDKDPSADPTFVGQRRTELAELKTRRADLEKQPLRPPARGSWFVMEQVPIRRRLACDPAVVAEKTELDRAVGEANRKAAAGQEPAPVPAGGAGYVGIEECGYCHKEEVAFWKKTHHAQAWKTLTDLGKEWSRECIGCHVTGWQEPGGATFAKNELLRDAQCEVCHGPASKHVEADGKEKPKSLVLVPDKDRCFLSCHTPEHSDTFQYEAYLRDMTGSGHGEKFRQKLGAGPTGHELRSAALEKAGRELGAGCKK